MQATAIRPVDPAELPGLVREAVDIVDNAALADGDRAIMLPLVFNVLCARVVVQQAPTIAGLGGLGGLGLNGAR